MIEETVPVPLLAITNSEHPDQHAAPFERAPDREVLELLSRIYQAMIESGIPHATAIQRLRVMEPFDGYPELVQSFAEDNPKKET